MPQPYPHISQPLIAGLIAFASLLTACTKTEAIPASLADAGPSSETSPARSQEIGDAPAAALTYELEELATGLNHPSSIAFLPGGELLVAERNGGLRIIVNGALQDAPIAGLPPIHVKSQAGFQEVVLSPEYGATGEVFIAYSHGTAKANGTRLAKAQLVLPEEGGAGSGELRNLEILFTREPWSTTSNHYGGRIAFLPDNTLLLALGEGYKYKDEAVNLDNHFGKIIRLNLDGSIPEDNPFVGQDGAKAEIYSYGHRNPQGLIVTKDGTIISHEHGPKGGDEVNIIKAGANYGWPVITYGLDYSGATVSPYSAREGLAQSVIHFIPSIAPSGLTMYDGDLFPDWQGDLFIGALAHRHIRRIDVQADGTYGTQEELFGELDARIRDVRTGPDGALYFVTDAAQGKLYRASPKAP
ncbi:MAG: PQQ-dependent sugar dehydrogenase [Parvularculaceae bacterium]